MFYICLICIFLIAIICCFALNSRSTVRTTAKIKSLRRKIESCEEATTYCYEVEILYDSKNYLTEFNEIVDGSKLSKYRLGEEFPVYFSRNQKIIVTEAHAERIDKIKERGITIMGALAIFFAALTAALLDSDEVRNIDKYFENSTTGEIVEHLDETLLYEYFVEYGYEFSEEARLCQNCHKLYDRDYNDGSDDYCDNCDSKNKYCNVCTESPRSIDELSKFEYNGETYYICTGCINNYIKMNKEMQEYILENNNW